MSRDVMRFRVFMASPSDLLEERNAFREVLDAINRSRGHAEGFHLEPTLWEKYAYPEADDPQAIINKLFVDADLVIVAFWNKFGAPTKEFPSGTMEEFSKAYDRRKTTGKPSIKIYFRQPLPPKDLAQVEELSKILTFKESIKDKALYKEYIEFEKFKDYLYEHVNAWLSTILRKRETGPGRVTRLPEAEPITDIKSVVKGYFQELEKKYDGLNRQHICFGIAPLDRLIGSLDSHNLVLVAGEDAEVNRTLLISLTHAVAATAKKGVLFISPRLPKRDLVERFISHNGCINISRLNMGYLKEEDWGRMSMAAGMLSEQLLYIDDNYETSVGQIRAAIAKAGSLCSLHLVVIDGLNYVSSDDAKLGHELRILSREARLPIICALDMSAADLRVKRNGYDKRPILSDLDRVAGIRTEADTVIFTYKSFDFSPNSSCCEIIVGKNKNGPVGTVNLRLLPQICRFEEINAAKSDEESLKLDL